MPRNWGSVFAVSARYLLNRSGSGSLYFSRSTIPAIAISTACMVCEACSESEWTRFWMSALPFASAAFLASNAFQVMTPRTLAVITSAKAMISNVDDIRRNGPPGSGGFRWGIACLDDRARPRRRQRGR
jgi:hypothetical protein